MANSGPWYEKSKTSRRHNSTTTTPFLDLKSAIPLRQQTLSTLCSDDRQFSVLKNQFFKIGEHTVANPETWTLATCYPRTALLKFENHTQTCRTIEKNFGLYSDLQNN